MARPSAPGPLEQLKRSNSPAAQLAALKQLKNDIVGHERRKESVVRDGIVAAVSSCLKSCQGKRQPAAQTRIADSSGAPPSSFSDDWDINNQICLQCVFLVTSLAHGGKRFIAPLVAGNIPEFLLAFLVVDEIPPRVAVECLRAIAVIIGHLSVDQLGDYGVVRERVIDQILALSSLDALVQILAQDGRDSIQDEQFVLVLQILRYAVAGEPKRQASLVSVGILDLLASKLAAWMVSNESVFRYQATTLLKLLPPPPSKSAYCDIVLTIAAIVKSSPYRSARFFYSRDILLLFPKAPNIFPLDPLAPASETSHGPIALPWDRLLPKLALPPSKPDPNSKAFPPLNPGSADASRLPFVSSQHQASQHSNKESDDHTSDVIAWFAYQARTTTGTERIASLDLLVSLLAATELNVRQERALSFLIVPLIVQLIENADWAGNTKSRLLPWVSPERILALLIQNSAPLQRAAANAEAITVLTSSLKKSFDPVNFSSRAMWSPTPDPPKAQPVSLSDPAILGPATPSSELSNILYAREAIMIALSSLSEKEDDSPRKDIIRKGVIRFIVDALTPYPEPPNAEANPFLGGRMETSSLFAQPMDCIDPHEGNPIFVIVAALSLLMTLSRSTHVLRTSLIDGGVAKPVFKLLNHENILVKRAATDVITNLILHFSPIRDELMDSGALAILCKNAHSSHNELRISSLWALKHLVIQATSAVKMQVFNELGTGYLLQLLNGESPAGAQRNHLATANSRGEQVDLLNAEEETSMDVDEVMSSSDDESLYGPAHRRGIREKYGPAEDYVARLRPMKNSEESATLKSKRDDVRIQHHVLDLLRNMLLDSSSSPADIVDNVLNSVGSSRFLDIILSKLRPKSGTAAYSASSSTPGVRLPSLVGGVTEGDAPRTYIDSSAYQHEDILLCALYILVHIANGRPAHRQVIVSHPGMLQTLNPLFFYPASKIRVACVWLMHNILWVEDVRDTPEAIQRAGELRAAGIEERIVEASEDADLDTKERAKGVLESFKKLLGPPPEINRRRVWDR